MHHELPHITTNEGYCTQPSTCKRWHDTQFHTRSQPSRNTFPKGFRVVSRFQQETQNFRWYFWNFLMELYIWLTPLERGALNITTLGSHLRGDYLGTSPLLRCYPTWKLPLSYNNYNCFAMHFPHLHITMNSASIMHHHHPSMLQDLT
jgi:hypothetical protein